MLKKLGPGQFIKSIRSILADKPRIPPSLEDNQVLQVIMNRRSVRRFTDEEVSDDVFEAILEAGRVAPSTVNLQTWAFSVFNADSWRETFGRSIPFKGQRAVIVLGDAHRARVISQVFPHSPIVFYTVAVVNASLAAMNMNIAAEALGVSSVMLSETGQTGFLDAGFLKEKLELPDQVFPVTTIVFGYAKGSNPPMPPRFSLDQICFEGKYREADSQAVDDWLSQMIAGYKSTHLSSSFDAQLKLYKSKIGQAEADLTSMVFYDDSSRQV